MTPHKTPCFECLVDLFPKDPYNFPICTTADKPRSPEHCIVFVMDKIWPDKYGKDYNLDGDNEEHIKFVMTHAQDHAKKFSLDDKAVTYKLTQGVVKRIIPAIASTNACISAACAQEAFKIVTKIYSALDNFSNFAGDDGCYSAPTSNQLNESCLVCGSSTLEVKFPSNKSLQNFIDYIKKDKGLFAFYDRPTLMWDDEASDDSDDSSHESEYIYTSNAAMMDETLLPKQMVDIFKEGSYMLLSQPQKKKKYKNRPNGYRVYQTKQTTN